MSNPTETTTPKTFEEAIRRECPHIGKSKSSDLWWHEGPVTINDLRAMFAAGERSMQEKAAQLASISELKPTGIRAALACDIRAIPIDGEGGAE